MPKTVLDLGAFNGCASAEFVEEGDTWILVDSEQWKGYEHWPHPTYPENAVVVISDLMEYYHEPVELVVCSNVLYHVDDPLGMIAHLRTLTKDKLILRTFFDKKDIPGPKSITGWNWHFDDVPAPHFHESTAATIYYRPTLEGLKDALISVGFIIENVTMIGGNVIVVCKLKEGK